MSDDDPFTRPAYPDLPGGQNHPQQFGAVTAELIRDLDQCPNPHLEKGAQLWRIGRRFRIICQFCAGCYAVAGYELAALERRFGIEDRHAR